MKSIQIIALPPWSLVSVQRFQPSIALLSGMSSVQGCRLAVRQRPSNNQDGRVSSPWVKEQAAVSPQRLTRPGVEEEGSDPGVRLD